MTIPASKVRALCTSSEVALVRASRRGELDAMTAADLRRLSASARKLLEKWQDLGRDQSRARNRKVGFGDTSENTRLKEEIFREALARFDEQLARIDQGTAGPASKSQSKKPMKKNRTTGHRSTRTALRKEMIATKKGLNAPIAKQVESKPATRVPAPAPAPSTANAPAAAAPTAKKTTRAPRAVAKAVPARKPLTLSAAFPAKEQRKIGGAAKKARLIQSGKKTRVLGHVVASGKRAQARRDRKK